MINLLIVDDHALVRMGIRRLLENLPDIKVIAEADNGESALMLVRSHNPHIVLLDMKMPGMDGWEVTRRLNKTHPNIKVIAVTATNLDPLFPSRLLQLGAMGYLSKESNADEMAMAIRRVHLGERYVSSEIAQQMALNSLTPAAATPFDKLSMRERQVMLMITRDMMTVPEIADTLFLSPKTVNGYRYQLFEKLAIKNDVELTYLAMKYSIIAHPTHIITHD